ncbi:MAG: nicotinate (nicotinamide) nucleotide adenylyltransferase [Flavobacteriaceae bacterium]|jgi:nicotinate-nucleotide adenylyltransferase|nr:nicotinate-nucleotide adenylyltransferase [Formosa sp.]MDA9760707.1 nicotinate (nicotinamide) nucleotide adenylyltransferase [Flavobacteriaceae bacterium]MDG1672855.1 nicotinate (nicotinamide) nucleotide adenylyltransferase [Flavobacteriaceae bacterium]MDG2483499.1 nicotinate (nicotinamide) nucleotide adenylyltransferase [Flavobacteriaceae bacterium]
MKVGLYFGTFNPIHVGHLIIANHFAEHSDLEEVWCVVTPQNPFKTKQSVLDNHQRLEMVYLATKEYPKIKPSDIEFQLPQPNYTVHSLAYLEEKYPKHEFALIMGEDNLASLPKWKNAEVLLDRYPIYVYPRKIEQSYAAVDSKGTIIKVDAPIIEISSSFIRKSIKSAKNIRPLLPESVWVYLDEMNFYK